MTGRRWAIVGVGGVGGLYAGRLHAAGCEVHLVARGDADALRADGLHLTSPLGDVHVRLPVHTDPATVPPVDVVALAAKTTAPAAAATAVAIASRHPGAALLVLQNGLGVEGAVGAPDGVPVLGGMAFVCSERIGPGRVRHLDFGPVSVGEHRPDGGAAGVTPAVAAAVADLDAAGVGGIAVPDLVLGRWRKLVWNVPFNGLAVVLRARTDEMLADPSATALVRTLMDEVRAGAAADGREIPPGFVDEMLSTTAAMTPYAPSMRLDFDAGRPLELDAIYAAPLAAARAAGVELPATATLLAQLRFLARGRDRPGDGG
ncbi:2-dehydropantoate 2-reductase [Iamia sp. SCSIO 61187]|uniref:2-dehydropantoate 2-reductase n=1 Tax=Iamia sp. SCSIO 61187 TaxID=2722752 RepID=UPI001C62C330|nr:2-dehydropantoate 2-reductase [Iamia sp. SCSIO 61187]QYG92181.1 2-dehydropantoate 2-reductase [Iamia sp. SCSIO 61187]